MYKYLRWLTIIVPVTGVALFELLRFAVVPTLFPSLFSDGWGGSAFLLVFVLLGGAIFSQGIFKIIDKQHQEITRERKKLESVFAYTSDGIILVDQSMKVLAINPAAELITGWHGQDVVDRLTCAQVNNCKIEPPQSKGKLHCSETCLNPTCGRSQCWGQMVFKTKESIPYVEMCVTDKNGFDKPVSASYSYIPGEGDIEPQVEIVLRDITERKELEKAMHDMTVLEERYRLAREMHDGLAQALCFLNVKCRTAQMELEKNNGPQQLVKEIAEMKDVIQEALEEVRHSIFDLKANPQLHQSFVAWLDDYIKKLGNSSSLKVEASIKLTKEWDMPTAMKIHLTRIVQEALNNVRKHAQATLVTVSIVENQEELKLTIADNGIGFVQEEIKNIGKKHFGLSIMEERANLIGGYLSIIPNQPRGTVIQLVLPLRKKNIKVS